ncbi:MAG: hypothetical protein AAGE92_16880 [Cyanobacteria bacterium P01_G01_bin.4]
MVLRYVTLANITARLGPRVKVSDDVADAFGQTVVPTTFITDQVGPQVEARYDTAIEANGVDPDGVSELTRQSIIEKLIVGEVLTTYFIGEDVSDESGGSAIAKQGERELKALWASTGGQGGGGNNLAKTTTYSGVCTRNVTRDDAAEKLQWR